VVGGEINKLWVLALRRGIRKDRGCGWFSIRRRGV
jgi:hypothetical protein